MEMPVEDRRVLLAEGPLPKFLRYVRIETTADPAAADVPSSPGQWRLLGLLEAEARSMGLQDVRLDRHGILTATLAACGASATAPAVGLLAHVDTSPAVSGAGVAPIVHRAYDGGVLRLPGGGVLDPERHPALREVVGHDLVTSDGRTLLGADDKAGVAEIMALAARLLREPQAPRARLRLGFTPDEEIGRGIGYFDLEGFGADVAYTLDGGALGDISWENFHAQNLTVVVRGRSAHTGSAKGYMVNALAIAAALIALAPATERPETTCGREGFIHFDALDGSVERAELTVLLRDFDAAGLEARRAWLESACGRLRAEHPGCGIEVRQTGGYRNMRDAVQRRPEAVRLALEAMRRAGVEPRPSLIRGGTDGARLSALGLPTPNLFAGGMDFHSLTEWISARWMEQAVDVLAALAGLWAQEG